MKRVIALLLACVLLTTSAAALDFSKVQEELATNEQLREGLAYILENMQNITNEIKNNEELQNGIQSVIGNVQAFTDTTAAMSDEELRRQILAIAEEHKIPDMNEEQIKFIISVCRSLEKADAFSDSVEAYGEKASQFGQSAKKLFDHLGAILEKLTDLMDTLNILLESKDSSK